MKRVFGAAVREKIQSRGKMLNEDIKRNSNNTKTGCHILIEPWVDYQIKTSEGGGTRPVFRKNWDDPRPDLGRN